MGSGVEKIVVVCWGTEATGAGGGIEDLRHRRSVQGSARRTGGGGSI